MLPLQRSTLESTSNLAPDRILGLGIQEALCLDGQRRRSSTFSFRL